jgi:hypothetical protein
MESKAETIGSPLFLLQYPVNCTTVQIPLNCSGIQGYGFLKLISDKSFEPLSARHLPDLP